MYVICVYDVNEKRCPKVMKVLRKYLFHIQNSVFEGELTPAKYKKLQKELDTITADDDQIIFYYSYSNKSINKIVNGKKGALHENIII